MTTAEVAQYLRLHPSSIYRLIKGRKMPAFRINGDYRFDRREIDKWVANLPRAKPS